jgi:hypothetical protein
MGETSLHLNPLRRPSFYRPVANINTVLHCKRGQCQTKNFMIEEHRHIGQKIGDKRHKDLRKAKQYQFTRSDWF